MALKLYPENTIQIGRLSIFYSDKIFKAFQADKLKKTKRPLKMSTESLWNKPVNLEFLDNLQVDHIS